MGFFWHVFKNNNWFIHFPAIPSKIYTKYICYDCSCQSFSIYGSSLLKYLHCFPFLFTKNQIFRHFNKANKLQRFFTDMASSSFCTVKIGCIYFCASSFLSPVSLQHSSVPLFCQPSVSLIVFFLELSHKFHINPQW